MIAQMTPSNGTRLRKVLTLIGFLAILSLLAAGQIAATVLIILPLAFVIFGKKQGKPSQEGATGPSNPDSGHPDQSSRSSQG